MMVGSVDGDDGKSTGVVVAAAWMLPSRSTCGYKKKGNPVRILDSQTFFATWSNANRQSNDRVRQDQKKRLRRDLNP